MAVEALEEAGDDAKIIAAGRSLVPMLNFRMLRPSILVDINRVAGLDVVEETSGAILVARSRALPAETSPLVAASAGAVLRHDPCGAFGDPQPRHHRRQFGARRPAAELPMMALLLDAELRVRSASGERTVAARDFFLGA